MISLEKVLADLAPYRARLVAVSKTQPITAIADFYQQGQRLFGENQVQELVSKRKQLPDDIEWHLVGQLQRNKVSPIASFVSLIHSGDRLPLLQEINRQAEKHNRLQPVLLQLKIAQEETKHGFSEEGVIALLNDNDFRALKHIQIQGLMGIATQSIDANVVRAEFRGLRRFFDRLKTDYFNQADYFKELSIGMSSDYHIALDEGATLVRIGSKLFGERHYPDPKP